MSVVMWKRIDATVPYCWSNKWLLFLKVSLQKGKNMIV